jgi:hypothetical protein
LLKDQTHQQHFIQAVRDNQTYWCMRAELLFRKQHLKCFLLSFQLHPSQFSLQLLQASICTRLIENRDDCIKSIDKHTYLYTIQNEYLFLFIIIILTSKKK